MRWIEVGIKLNRYQIFFYVYLFKLVGTRNECGSAMSAVSQFWVSPPKVPSLDMYLSGLYFEKDHIMAANVKEMGALI